MQEEAELNMYLYQYHDDVMQNCLAEMQECVYEIDTFEDTYVSGTIHAAEDGILYTSIPYYRGFKAYVDGKETEIVKIGDVMIGVRVSAGVHTVEFRYFTYGLKIGIVVSLFGMLLLAGSVFYKKRRKR